MTAHKTTTERTKEIVAAALDLAEKKSYLCITRAEVATAAGISEAHVSWVFGTMVQFRRAVMRAAIQQRRYRIIAQGLAVKDKQCGKLPNELVAKAADALKG